jgi:hypothetical protein
MNTPVVTAVSLRAGHHFSKSLVLLITLVAGYGVAGDGHYGGTIQHLSRKKKFPDLVNNRQVHVLQAELFDELALAGFTIGPGDMGENITTRGVDLLNLPLGTRLHIGGAVIELTGLRNPCVQMDRFAPGLMAANLTKTADGALIRKSGVMAVVVTGGQVRAGDAVVIAFPSQPHHALEPV